MNMNEKGSAWENETAFTDGPMVRLVVSWAWVGVPMAWGVWETVVKSLSLFG